MASLQRGFPKFSQNMEGVDDSVKRVVSSLLRSLEVLRKVIITVVNENEITFVSQASRPTPANGRMQVWKDSDATSGNPTHYIVYTDTNGTTVTFRSVELVP
jgi:hypothetical protein